MNFKKIEMDHYKRKSHFDYFNSLAFPYVGTTLNIDITKLQSAVKAQKLPFFLTICYCVSRAANAVPEFRQRIANGGIIEYENCRTSHTVALEDGTYCYCTLEDRLSFWDYLEYGRLEQQIAKEKRDIEENDAANDLLYISTLPWLSYAALVQPVPVPADSNPRITWGKFFTQNERILLPVSVLCHHALVDGKHIADFYEALAEQCERVCELISTDPISI